jgi:hypothetical protein
MLQPNLQIKAFSNLDKVLLREHQKINYPILWDGHTMANATLRYRQAQHKSCPSLMISGLFVPHHKKFLGIFLIGSP